MKKQVYEIDASGFIKEIYVTEIIDGEILEQDKKSYVIIDPPNGLYKAKWKGTKWVEGETAVEKEEREMIEKIKDLQPSQTELEDAKLEIKILTLLSELELI